MFSKNKGKFKKKAYERYQNISEEETDKKRQHHRDQNKNLS